MKKIINRVGTIAMQQGLSLRKTTDDRKLEEFFRKVRPVATQFDLIRVGGNNDGGYLLPDDLEGIEVCFSPGVSKVATFETALANRGIRSFLADYSIDAPPELNPLFKFEKKFLGMEDNSVYMTLESWVASNEAGYRADMILQMDIEGGEYDVIFDTSNDLLRRFRILVIEFHDLHLLLDKCGYQFLDTCFRKLLKNFEVVHVHPNNCTLPIRAKEYWIHPIMEFTFLRKDRITHRRPTLRYPHELDQRNVLANEDVPLPDFWFKDPGEPPL